MIAWQFSAVGTNLADLPNRFGSVLLLDWVGYHPAEIGLL